MKAKVKFDKTAILKSLAQHGEKIAFAGVLICFVLIVFGATGGEKFQKSPADLSNQANLAGQKIEQGTSEVKAEPVKLTQETPKIDLKPYEFTKLIASGSVPTERNPQIYAPKSLRGEPVLYSVELLLGVGGHGRFTDRGAAGWGGRMAPEGMAPGQPQTPLGERWVVLTGIVDVEKYYKSFYDCFKATKKHDQTDFEPVFQGFYVQRAEITDENEPVENLRWEQPYKNFLVERDRFTSSATNLIDPRYTDPDQALVFPLPPRMDGQWGKEVAHPPEIPLMSQDSTMPGAPPGTMPGETTPEPGDPFRGAGGAGLTGPAARGGGMTRPGGMRSPRGMGMAGPMGEYGRPGEGTADQVESVPYYLFRFFDYHVEPGKRYRYRIRIVVSNPNFGRSEQELVKELRSRMKEPGGWSAFLYSPWSEPSEIVSVPRDDRLMVASVTPARGIDSEPRGTVKAVHWDYQDGEEIHDEFEISRGWLADFLEQKPPVDPQKDALTGGAPRTPMGAPEENPLLGPRGRRPAPPTPGGRRPTGRRPQPTTPEEPAPQTVNYRTEMIVLDMDGGETLPGRNRLTSPGEMLLLAPDGTLEVRNDVDDERLLLEQEKAKKIQPGMQPGGMYPGRGPGEMRGPRGLQGPMGRLGE